MTETDVKVESATVAVEKNEKMTEPNLKPKSPKGMSQQCICNPLQNYVAAALQPCFKIINLTLLPRTESNCCLYLFQGL